MCFRGKKLARLLEFCSDGLGLANLILVMVLLVQCHFGLDLVLGRLQDQDKF